tara:strand:- start:1669 stop:2253 length:585 start_codon:yes stop_codon:yes gene_type:complete
MTEQVQAADAAEAAADAVSQTVSREELNEAISRRQSALERARAAEERVAKLETAQTNKARAEKEAQGRYKELAEESGARVAALAKELETKSKRLDFLNGRQRETVQARFEALPQAVKDTLAGRLGESPDLEAFESSVELAESFQTESRQPVPRNLGAQPSAGRVASVSTGGKSSAADIAKMSRAEQAAYLQKNY